MEIGRVKSEKWSFEGCGHGDGKMRGKEGFRMKNKRRFRVKVKTVSEKGRNLMNFGEELKVLSKEVMKGLEGLRTV